MGSGLVGFLRKANWHSWSLNDALRDFRCVAGVSVDPAGGQGKDGLGCVEHQG